MSLANIDASTKTPDDLFVPVDDQYDWLQLTSNELVRGTIKGMFEEKLEFSSQDLGTQVIDWDDIKLLQSANVITIGLTDFSTETGFLTIRNGKGYINNIEFSANEVLTLIAGEQTEANYWSSNISLGANIKRGNTNQVDYSAIANTTRRTTHSRFTANYLGNFTRTEKDDIVNNHRLNSNLDWFLSNRFYFRIAFGELYVDPIQNIEYRVTVSSGLGYELVETPTTQWNVTLGPGYNYTRFENLANEQDPNSTEGSSLVMESLFSTDLTSNINLTSDFRSQYDSKESSGYSHHFINTLKIKLNGTFSLNVSLVWDRLNNPAINTLGEIPKEDDLQFIFGLGIDI